MSKGPRLILFLVLSVILVIISFVLTGRIFPNDDIDVIIFSSVIMMSFTVLLVENFFTSPNDVIANTISILLLLAPLHVALGKLGVWYWVFFVLNSILLITAILSVFLYDPHLPSTGKQNTTANYLKTISSKFGNGRFLYFCLFLLVMLFYVDTSSNKFLILFIYSFVIAFIDPKSINIHFGSKNSENEIGEIIGVHSENTYLVRLHNGVDITKCLSTVKFRLQHNSINGSRVQRGVIIGKYLLDQQEWIKVLNISEIDPTLSAPTNLTAPNNGVIYEDQFGTNSVLLKNFVGIIAEGSNNQVIHFEYCAHNHIEEGTLLEVKIDGKIVLYQVFQGITRTEKLEEKDERGYILGEAYQLGCWNTENLNFERYGWVPKIDTPVFIASQIDQPQLPNNKYLVGCIPNSNYPIVIDPQLLVTHHTAILGVTGCGKSFLARNLIREIIRNGTKIICVDFTNEYLGKFQDQNPRSITTDDEKTQLFGTIDLLSQEKEKFPNQQNAANIARWENTITTCFTVAITRFLQSEANICIFELPDVSNTSGILDYTKWFFKILFKIAKENSSFGKRICVVLEEAHTVIPEWNFIGVSEKKADSLVNNISQIALQGRKYNIGFIVIAQRTANVSKTVLTQCNTVIAFQQFDKTSMEFLSNYFGNQMINALSTLRFRQAVAFGKAFNLRSPVIFEIPELEDI